MPGELRAELRDYFAGIQDGTVEEREAAGLACLWFDPDRRRCRHYHHRPSVCREFEVGGADCVNWRRRAGLDSQGRQAGGRAMAAITGLAKADLPTADVPLLVRQLVGGPPLTGGPVRRWMTEGCMGVKLFGVRRGARWYTSEAAVKAFLAALNGGVRPGEAG